MKYLRRPVLVVPTRILSLPSTDHHLHRHCGRERTRFFCLFGMVVIKILEKNEKMNDKKSIEKIDHENSWEDPKKKKLTGK